MLFRLSRSSHLWSDCAIRQNFEKSTCTSLVNFSADETLAAAFRVRPFTDAVEGWTNRNLRFRIAAYSGQLRVRQTLSRSSRRLAAATSSCGTNDFLIAESKNASYRDHAARCETRSGSCPYLSNLQNTIDHPFEWSMLDSPSFRARSVSPARDQ